MNRSRTSAPRPLLSFQIRSLGEPIYKARARVGDLARRLGFGDDDVDAIQLAFSEALTNALRHGCPTSRNCVHVKAGTEDSCLVLEVADHGHGFHPGEIRLPPLDADDEGGRGLYLMQAFMDDVQWFDSPKGTTVRLCKACPCSPNGACAS
jgi:serine/threonine-protein kinase RsbW